MTGDPDQDGVDTASRETFYTDAGRVVYGGGGITPDLIVTPDTLTTAEQAFREALADSEVALRDLSFRFSVRWAHDHPELREDFEITPAMLDAFFAFLVEEEGAELSRELYDEAAGWIEWELGIRIAQASFGEVASLKRTLRRQPQVTTAIALLEETESTQGLFALAAREHGETAAEDSDARRVARPN